jgi:sulfatase maturation enzyme AslB (radical SAM superfamily)
MDYAYSKKKNLHFNLTSNGIKFLSQKFINEYKSNFFQKMGLISLDISFDGIGNGERVYHNGMESTSSMIKVFKNLMENGVEFRIRYTMTNLNVDYLYEDMTMILKTFKPKRLITSVAWETIKDTDQIKLDSAKNRLRSDWINKQLNAPVCEFFCDMCSGCGERKQLKTYYTDEGNVTTYGNYENAPKFHDFKEKDPV